jgi:hypothetical protein
MTTKYGSFSEPGYLHPHAATAKPTAAENKEHKLSSLKIGGTHRGKVTFCAFSNFEQ